MGGFRKLGIFATLDINSSNNARIRALGKLDSGGTKEYQLIISTVSASNVKIEDAYYEWNADADMETILVVDTDGVVPFIQLQIMAETVGATAAQIDYCEITKVQTHKNR